MESLKRIVIIIEVITGIVLAIVSYNLAEVDPFRWGLIFTILLTPLVIFITLFLFGLYERYKK